MLNFDCYMLLSETLDVMGLESKIIEINDALEKKVYLLKKVYRDWETNEASKKKIEKERNQLMFALVTGFLTTKIYKSRKQIKDLLIEALEITEENFNKMDGKEITKEFKLILNDALPSILKEKVEAAINKQQDALKKTL